MRTLSTKKSKEPCHKFTVIIEEPDSVRVLKEVIDQFGITPHSELMLMNILITKAFNIETAYNWRELDPEIFYKELFHEEDSNTLKDNPLIFNPLLKRSLEDLVCYIKNSKIYLRPDYIWRYYKYSVGHLLIVAL